MHRQGALRRTPTTLVVLFDGHASVWIEIGRRNDRGAKPAQENLRHGEEPRHGVQQRVPAKEVGLLPPPRLRTGRESFPSSGSSISKAV